MNKRVDMFEGPNVCNSGVAVHTPVATGSMRKLLRTEKILTLRDADDGSQGVRGDKYRMGSVGQ